MAVSAKNHGIDELSFGEIKLFLTSLASNGLTANDVRGFNRASTDEQRHKVRQFRAQGLLAWSPATYCALVRSVDKVVIDGVNIVASGLCTAYPDASCSRSGVVRRHVKVVITDETRRLPNMDYSATFHPNEKWQEVAAGVRIRGSYRGSGIDVSVLK